MMEEGGSNNLFLPPSQNDCPVICRVRIRGSKSNICVQNLIYQEVVRHRNCQGRFGVVLLFYFESHTYIYLVNDQWALISPKLEMRTIMLGWREYKISY